MKKYSALVVLFMFVASSQALAKANLSGAWINEGKTLSIQIVDDPSEAPFSAGELWNAMSGTGRVKTIKTQNLEIQCTAILNEGVAFGSCNLLVNKEKIENLGSKPDYLFSAVDEEAQEVLSQFNQRYDKFLLVCENDQKEFRLEANWKKQTVAFLIYNELIQP